MSAGWLVYALFTGSLIAGGASALDALARARRWPTRWIWALAMLAMLVVVSSIAFVRDDAGSARVVESVASAGVPIDGVRPSMLVSMLRDLRTIAETTLAVIVTSAAQRLPAALTGAGAVLWFLGAIAALTTLAFVHLRLRRARRSWPSAVLHGRRVRVAPTEGPAVVGVVRPEIVVPRWLLARDAEEQRLVLAHEEEHVRARDHLLLGGACVAVALMPWHPAAWWALTRLRLAIELDCDARVLRHGVQARSYGEMLIDLAGQCSGFRVGATALADKTSHLERRLLAMKPITKRFALVRGGALCAAAVLSLAAACEARVPTSAEIQSMDVAGAERTAAKTGLMTALHGGQAVEFYVNDVLVSAEQAHAIPPNDIATVNVEKGAAGSAASVIRIRTLATAANGMKYRTGGPVTISGGPVVMDKERTTFGPARLHEKIAVSDGTFSGIVLIDGVRADAAALHKLDPKDIVSVEITKGAAAGALLNDPAAKDGIINVTTSGRRTKG